MEHSCFFLKGVLQGICEGLFGETVETVETKCKSSGDKLCRFDISFFPKS
jgi:predicted hydrocarbon binding protein